MTISNNIILRKVRLSGQSFKWVANDEFRGIRISDKNSNTGEANLLRHLNQNRTCVTFL